MSQGGSDIDCDLVVSVAVRRQDSTQSSDCPWAGWVEPVWGGKPGAMDD
jgi:hypothetical protein